MLPSISREMPVLAIAKILMECMTFLQHCKVLADTLFSPFPANLPSPYHRRKLWKHALVQRKANCIVLLDGRVEQTLHHAVVALRFNRENTGSDKELEMMGT